LGVLFLFQAGFNAQNDYTTVGMKDKERPWTTATGRVSYEITARTVKFPAHRGWAAGREGNGGAPMPEPPPRGEDSDVLRF